MMNFDFISIDCHIYELPVDKKEKTFIMLNKYIFGKVH